jgi:hypothetical protein
MDLDRKIASCIEASKSTSYPWILHWVYRELARAHRERGEIQKAIASYAQSLAAEEREAVRRKWRSLSYSRSNIANDLQPHLPCTGITAYLENGGTLEKARQMAAHASTRTTQLYDRREDRVTLAEVVKINIRR